MLIVVTCQLLLLIYHQITTWFDFYPYNNVRLYTRKEKFLECGINGLLMLLPPIGFYFHIHSLETFGVVYYFVLFAIEIILWWVPYFFLPSGRILFVYNYLLRLATCDFSKGNTFARWKLRYDTVHRKTLIILPNRSDRIIPNLDHTILHSWTLITAIVTAIFYFKGAV